jgi:hypothetical protein
MLRCGCNNIAKDASVFDPSSPDGDYELDMSNSYVNVTLLQCQSVTVAICG